jgi:tRNA (mo5U34)-methyltransferase
MINNSHSFVSDESLEEINNSLNWHSGVTLPDGRLLGSLTKSKRKEPESIPDYRVERLHKTLDLNGKKVLEVGCFEGAHTASFLNYTDDVTAIDIRPQNVINTLMRLSVLGHKANVLVANVEDLDGSVEKFDVLFHCGVLYHLTNPVKHFKKLSGLSDYILLDTHIAHPSEKPEEIDGYEGVRRVEGGWSDPFSGKDSYAVWLTEESLKNLIKESGYSVFEEWETRTERNGLRISWLLKAD